MFLHRERESVCVCVCVTHTHAHTRTNTHKHTRCGLFLCFLPFSRSACSTSTSTNRAVLPSTDSACTSRLAFVPKCPVANAHVVPPPSLNLPTKLFPCVARNCRCVIRLFPSVFHFCLRLRVPCGLHAFVVTSALLALFMHHTNTRAHMCVRSLAFLRVHDDQI